MGFAAQLRYHWMEPVVYKSMLYIPLAIISGLEPQDVAIVHFCPHHRTFEPCQCGLGLWSIEISFEQPKDAYLASCQKPSSHIKYGVNFGLTLSFGIIFLELSTFPTTAGILNWDLKETSIFRRTFCTRNYILLKPKGNRLRILEKETHEILEPNCYSCFLIIQHAKLFDFVSSWVEQSGATH